MREYKIFIDENFPSQIAEGFHILVQPKAERDGLRIQVFSIKKEFGQGAKDEEWIPVVGKQKGIVITQDFRIQTIKHQRELYKEHGVGILFFSPPSKGGFGYWEMVKQIVNRWDEMVSIIKHNKVPFGFRCSAKTKFENLFD
jgi:hypothetical protein